MRKIDAVVGTWVALALSAGCVADTVSFESRGGGRAATISAALRVPDGAGPFPAVILLHGCTGFEDDQGGIPRRGLERHAAALTAAGFVTLMVDSYGSRGFATAPLWRDSCRNNAYTNERAADLYAAADRLAARPDVRADAIGVMGLSQGGLLTLRAMTGRGGDAWGRRFRAGVAFYPPCRVHGAFVGPLLILIGEDDDITPASSCRATIRSEEVRRSQLVDAEPDVLGVLPELVVYPGVHHSFDLPIPRMMGTPIGTVAADPAAAADARARMIAFFNAHLGT